MIEIDLAGKYRVRVGNGVDAQALRRVLDVLERRCIAEHPVQRLDELLPWNWLGSSAQASQAA